VGWKGKVDIELPHSAGAKYNVSIDGDLTDIASRLPPPLDKPAGKALPVKVNVEGNLRSFDLTGSAGNSNHFNSRWLLNQKLTLDRAIWTSDSRTMPPLPEQAGLELNLPPMNGAQWLGLLRRALPTTSATRPLSRPVSRCARRRSPWQVSSGTT
jgi:uncharacterized protein YhdP